MRVDSLLALTCASIQIYFRARKYETARYFWRLSLRAMGVLGPPKSPLNMPLHMYMYSTLCIFQRSQAYMIEGLC